MINNEGSEDFYSSLLQSIKKHWIVIIIFIGIPLIVLVGYVYVSLSFKYLDYADSKNLEYEMVKPDNEICDVIISIYSSHAGAFITLNDSSKIWIEASINKMYAKYLLCDFLQINDSLIKKINNDTLFVHRGSKQYYFVIGKLDNSN